MELDAAFRACPLVAILRGVKPNEVVAIGNVLVEAGFTMLEVPLNSPDPLRSIGLLADVFGGKALVGAGTVLSRGAVADVQAAGGRLIVMPHGDVAVIEEAKDRGLVCLPGVVTPTEAFAALAAGADGLKLFPAELIGPPAVKAMRAVLPAGVKLLAVGGIAPETMAAYRAAGASGFGLGGALYGIGSTPDEVARRAGAFVAALS